MDGWSKRRDVFFLGMLSVAGLSLRDRGMVLGLCGPRAAAVNLLPSVVQRVATCTVHYPRYPMTPMAHMAHQSVQGYE